MDKQEELKSLEINENMMIQIAKDMSVSNNLQAGYAFQVVRKLIDDAKAGGAKISNSGELYHYLQNVVIENRKKLA